MSAKLDDIELTLPINHMAKLPMGNDKEHFAGEATLKASREGTSFSFVPVRSASTVTEFPKIPAP